MSSSPSGGGGSGGSSGDDPFGNLGDDPSPSGVLSGVTGFLQGGGSLGTLLQSSIFGLLVSSAIGGVNLIQSIVGLVVAPINAMADAVTEFISEIILEPLGLISETAETSTTAISLQFGPFAFLVGIIVLLAGFWLITQFLEEEETPDFIAIPGFPDLPVVGVEEDGED